MYNGFARIYDELMEDAPYEKWGAYIDNVLKQRFSESKNPLVLDLACGTGAMTLLLAKKGYDMIGVDVSIDMLATAQQKSYEEKQNILFLAQDMRELDLFGTIDAAVCVCDGLNYILEEDDLFAIFKRVRLFLNPGGVFILDMNTEYKFKELLGNRSFEGKSKTGAAYSLDNNYDENTMINEYRVLFHAHEKDDSFTEVHKQRAYKTEKIVKFLLEAGFCDVLVTHEYTNEPPKVDSERVSFVAMVRK